jgi:hypothetical protein
VPLPCSIRKRDGDSGSPGTQKVTRPLVFFLYKIAHNWHIFLAHCDTVQGKRQSRIIVIRKTNEISISYHEHHPGMNFAYFPRRVWDAFSDKRGTDKTGNRITFIIKNMAG